MYKFIYECVRVLTVKRVVCWFVIWRKEATNPICHKDLKPGNYTIPSPKVLNVHPFLHMYPKCGH